MRQGIGWEGVDAAWETPKDPRAYDALADLFLGEQTATATKANGVHPESSACPLRLDDSPAPAPAPTAAPEPAEAPQAARTIEALILGHLPAMPGAWAVQVALGMSERQAAPVALVRSADGVVTVELVGEDAIGVSAQPTLEDALGVAAALAPRALVRLEPGGARSLVNLPLLTGVTLATGADEPAVIAAYATLKAIAADAGAGAPPCTLVFVGVNAAKAREAGEKLCRAAGAFLNLRVTWQAGPERIVPAPSVTLFRAPAAVGVKAIVAALHAACDAATSMPSEPEGPPDERDAGALSLGEPEKQPAADLPSPPASPAVAATEQSSTGAARELLPAVREAPFDCPDAPGLRLGIDSGGRLHAVAEGGMDQVAHLLAAQAWASRHRSLLSLAFRSVDGMTFDAEAPVRLTLVTTDAAACAALLRTPIHVRVRAGEVAVALND